MTQLHFTTSLLVTPTSFSAAWKPGTLQSAVLLLPMEIRELVNDFRSVEEFLSAVHASPTAFTLGLGWTAENWATAKSELLKLLDGKVDPRWLYPLPFPKSGANAVPPEAWEVDVTILDEEGEPAAVEPVPGTFEWAKVQTIPTARYCKRTGALLVYMSNTPGTDYPEKAEDYAATDWEHDRGLAKKPLNVGNLPFVHPHDALRTFLRLFKDVRIGIRSNHPDCVLPQHLKSQETAVLVVGLNYSIPIPDLRATQLGLYCTLRFSGVYQECYIPWDAFVGVANDANHTQLISWGTV